MSAATERLVRHYERLRPQVVRPANGFIRYDYCIPGGYYTELWDWDGFFIAVHMAGRTPPQPQYLKFWALNYVAAADDTGYAPGCVTPAGPEPGHRSFQMKPLLAQGAELAARLLGDDAWLAENYEAIRRIATRRETTNYDEASGLFAWDNAMQSGADNNPAITNDPANYRRVLSCDVNAFQWREYLALAAIAGRLGHAEDGAGFQHKADALRAAFNRHLWNEDDGSYWNRKRDSGEWMKSVSYSNFVPLWAGMAPRERGERMIREYLWSDDHLLSRFGLRTLSKQAPEYNNVNMIWPYSNWQGPVWPIANYFYFVGLINYGFPGEAKELTRRLADLCLDDIERCGAMHENYDAETGAPLAPSGDQSPKGLQEGDFIGWNLLIQDMIEMTEGKANLLTLA